MNHIKADFTKIRLVECLYHRTYMVHPNPKLLVTVDGEKREYFIRYRAAKKDALYHSKGLKCLLVVYEGFVLAYEIYKDIFAAPRNLDKLNTLIQNTSGDWYFDTEKFYQLNAVLDTNFISVQEVNVIDPIHITYSSTIEEIKNDVFVICKDNQILIQTPPIATSLERKIKNNLLLDNSQERMYISLAMLLKMCDVVSKLYGDEEIEKFDIPQYMIRHKTVNLMKLPQNVREKSTTHVKPVHAISYLLGLLYKETNFEHSIKLIKTIKLICRSGVIDSAENEAENVYKDKPVELKSLNLFEKHI